MFRAMRIEEEQADITFTENTCILSEKATQLVHSIVLDHRRGWTFTSVKIPDDWSEHDVLVAFQHFEDLKCLDGLYASLCLRREKVYSRRSYRISLTPERVDCYDTRMVVSIVVVKDPMDLSVLEDLNYFISELDEEDMLYGGSPNSEPFRRALLERARMEGVPDEIVLQIEEDGGIDLLESLYGRQPYWLGVINETEDLPEWSSILVWPYLNEDPFDLSRPSFSRELVVRQIEEIRKTQQKESTS